VEAEKSAPEIAREAVALMDALFAVERQAKDISVSERLELRQKQSVPILAELHRKPADLERTVCYEAFHGAAVNYTLGYRNVFRLSFPANSASSGAPASRAISGADFSASHELASRMRQPSRE